MESGLNQEVKDLLEFKYKEYNNKSFIEFSILEYGISS